MTDLRSYTGERSAVAPRRLNPTDATLWDIERDPTLRTTIVVVLHLAGPVDPDRLVEEVEAASRILPKLRQRVVALPGGVGPLYWALDPTFDVTDHVGFVSADDDFDALIASLSASAASVPFDRSKPLWSCTYVDRSPATTRRKRAGAETSTALILKVHHCLTDGIGGVELLDVLLNTVPGERRDLDVLPVPVAGNRLGALVADARHTTRQAVQIPAEASAAALSALGNPGRAVGGAISAVRSMGRLLAPNDGIRSPLLTKRSSDRIVTTIPVDLSKLHDAARPHRCTINHLFFAGVVGGFSAYHAEHDQALDSLRVVMPISVRLEADEAGGNQWAPARFVVPATIADPVARMVAMRDLTRASREERSVSWSKPLAGALQPLPSVVSSRLVGSMMRGVDLVLTNVPGPTQTRFLAGEAVERVVAFAPTAGAAANAALVSYCERADVGLLIDAAAVSDPDRLTELIERELEAVVAAAETTPAADDEPKGEGGPSVQDRSERLSTLDAGFLRLESPTTPMHVGGIAILDGDGLRGADGELRMRDIRAHVEARLQQLPAFRRKVVEVPLGLGRPVWVDDEGFDIDRHVLQLDLDGGGTRQALLDLAAHHLATPLSRDHALWEVVLVDGLDDGSVGLIEKVHHCLVDGVSGVELAVALFDAEPIDGPDHAAAAATASGPGPVQLLTDAVVELIVDPVATAREVVGAFRSVPGTLRTQARDVAGAVSSLARPSAFTRPASFNRPVGARRELHTTVVPLEQVIAAGSAHQATVNDVVLSVVAGGLRRWMDEHGEAPFDVHALVPVSLRGEVGVDPHGNRVGGIFVTLPIAEPDAGRRLRQTTERVRRLKAAHEGEGLGWVFDSLDHVPAPLTNALTRLLAGQRFANLVVTNVRGPKERLFFLGSRIDELIPVVPLAPRLGLGVAALSYAGRLTIAVSGDPDQCRNLDALARLIEDELDELTQSLGDQQ